MAVYSLTDRGCWTAVCDPNADNRSDDPGRHRLGDSRLSISNSDTAVGFNGRARFPGLTLARGSHT